METQDAKIQTTTPKAWKSKVLQVLSNVEAFLSVPEADLCSFEKSKFIIQQLPYEHTSSYLSGSAKGPAAIISSSHFVEFYDEELEKETYRECGIATLASLEFGEVVDEDAMVLIEKQTSMLLDENK